MLTVLHVFMQNLLTIVFITSAINLNIYYKKFLLNDLQIFKNRKVTSDLANDLRT